MRINSVSNGSNVSVTNVSADTIRANLEKIADRAGISVEQLIEQAKSAKYPTPTQERVVNLLKRLEKLEK
jgi:hypothetical protein